MTGNAAENGPPAQHQDKRGWVERIAHQGTAALTCGYLVVAITGLIVLRAKVHGLEFIGIGWLLGLAVIPLLPWALPQFGGFLQTLSRYVSKVDVGSVKIDLRDVTDTPIAVSTSSGVPPGLSDNVSALSSSTGIVSVIAALRSLQLQGGRPYATIDLQTGRKWRLPNLYYLSVLLERDPVVSLLFFTEMRRGIDGYFVRMGRPRELRVQIEQALPAYGEARSAVQLPAGGDLQEPNTAQQLANAFTQFRDKLPPDSGTENDLVFGFITAERLNALVVSPPGTVVESPGDTLSGEQLRTVVTAADRYVPTTIAGRLSGVIDRDAVAVAVARSALTPTAPT